VKLLLLVVVPPAVATVIGPLLAPIGTVAVMYPEESTTETANVPLNFTAVVPTNAEPFVRSQRSSPRRKPLTCH
jgi:hypothetical protein